MDDSKENHLTSSYVVPRIPSITGFGQRIVHGKTKKLLNYSLEKSNDHSGIPKIDVCLRLKPSTHNVSTGVVDTLTIVNDTTVAYNNGNGRDNIIEFTFSSVFGPDIDQTTFFKTWVYDKVLNFLNGENELIFAYGTTNAGKTFTIHGNLNEPGIIPKTLMLVFNTLNSKLMSQCMYKPDKVCDAHILDEPLMEHEENVRNHIFNNWSNERFQDDLKSHVHGIQTVHPSDQFHLINLLKMFDVLKNNEKASLDHGDVSYIVWVSYLEIYNESIYDLLATYLPNQKRMPLKLSLDKNKKIFVKGLTHVCVQSAEEAYKVILFGRNSLTIASNNLNMSSSRSHCIFTLKLMRIENVENPQTAVISSISFCDLAGSERLKKTMNVGDRLTESKNINTSLLVLNKCFSVLRENQKRGENHMVPYRESKLTQMFQTALTGNTNTGISMVVNVDKSPNLFEETKHVLFMSAIVRAITKVKSRTVSKPRPSFAIWAANNRKSITRNESQQGTIYEDEEYTNEQKSMNVDCEDFEVKLNEARAKLRKELMSQFEAILEQNNLFHQNQKQTLLKNKTEMYENKIKRLKEYYLEEIRERNEKLDNLNSHPNVKNNTGNDNTSEIENYEFRIGELQLQMEELLTENNNLKNMHAMRNEDMNIKNQEIESYKTMLEEAYSEYEEMEKDMNEMNNKFDNLFLEIEEKDLEIERLMSSLDTKDDIITEMENQRDDLASAIADQQILKYMDENSKIIAGLKSTIGKLTMKNNKYKEENSNIAMQYKVLKQKYLNMTKTQDTNDSLLSKLSDKDSKIANLQEYIKELECESKKSTMKCEELQTIINDLENNQIKPKSKSISVLTDLNNIHFPIQLITEHEDQENKNPKLNQQPQRKCRTKKTPVSSANKVKNMKTSTPDICDKIFDEVIDNIPISTRKRRLFNNKPPLVDNNYVSSDNMDSVLSPTRAIKQVTKLLAKK